METPKLLSAIAGVALAVGAIYNFGYFSSLGLNFFTLLTYKDHLTTLVFFAAPCLFLALLFYGWRRKNSKVDYFAVGWIGMVFALWAEKGEIASFPKLEAIAAWFMGFSSFFLTAYLIAVIFDFVTSGDLKKSGSNAQRFIGLAVIGLGIFVFIFGNYRYHTDISGSQFETEVVFDSGKKADDATSAVDALQPAHLVRVIDEGVFLILNSAPDRVIFLKKDSLKMLAQKVQR